MEASQASAEGLVKTDVELFKEVQEASDFWTKLNVVGRATAKPGEEYKEVGPNSDKGEVTRAFAKTGVILNRLSATDNFGPVHEEHLELNAQWNRYKKGEMPEVAVMKEANKDVGQTKVVDEARRSASEFKTQKPRASGYGDYKSEMNRRAEERFAKMYGETKFGKSAFWKESFGLMAVRIVDERIVAETMREYDQLMQNKVLVEAYGADRLQKRVDGLKQKYPEKLDLVNERLMKMGMSVGQTELAGAIREWDMRMDKTVAGLLEDSEKGLVVAKEQEKPVGIIDVAAVFVAAYLAARLQKPYKVQFTEEQNMFIAAVGEERVRAYAAAHLESVGFENVGI